MDKEIYFIRHGETDYNRLKIVQGSGVDSDLNEHGKLQAQLFYNNYRNKEFNLIITSALKRTQQTVLHFLAQEIPHIIDPRINEINWGVHEGKKSSDKMILAYKMLIRAWGRGELDHAIENGESAQQLLDRVSLFLTELKARPEKRILVCSHGRTLRCVMAALHGEEMSQMEKYEHANTGVFKVLLKDGSWQIDHLNDTQHLESI